MEMIARLTKQKVNLQQIGVVVKEKFAIDIIYDIHIHSKANKILLLTNSLYKSDV